MLKQNALGQKSDPKAAIILCSRITLMGGMGSFSIFCVVGRSTAAILCVAMALILSSDS